VLTRNALLNGSASALLLMVASCAGGGGSTGGIATVSVPVPAPSPTPADAAPVQVFPNVPATTDFGTLGIEASSTKPPVVTDAAVSVHYDAPTGSYVMSFPREPAAPFYEFTNVTKSATWWFGDTLEPSGNAPAIVNVLKPSNPELQLTYTTLASYDTSGLGPGPFGWTAFGTATGAGAVPTSGSASYAALVRGSEVDKQGMIQGTASLLFDFSAGKLSGHMDPVYMSYSGMGETEPLGRYDFANTIYARGSTSFSGQLSNSSFSQSGTFNGQFTGPAAQELMSTWSAPFHNPISNTDSQMFGVLVGKRP